MELKIVRGRVIYDSGEQEYELPEMQESHIMNVLGKFELQRMVMVRLSSLHSAENEDNSFHIQKIEQIDKKMQVFIKEMQRRIKEQAALRELEDSLK